MTIDTTVTTETPTSQRPLVKDMDEQARIAYLAGLMSKRVRYARTRDTAPLLQAFGEYAVIPWQEGVADSFALDGSSKVIVFEGEPYHLRIGITPRKERIRLDLLYDVQPIVDEPQLATPEPDYDGADVYAADEVACPHCGHTLRITQRATVEMVREGEEEGDTE